MASNARRWQLGLVTSKWSKYPAVTDPKLKQLNRLQACLRVKNIEARLLGTAEVRPRQMRLAAQTTEDTVRRQLAPRTTLWQGSLSDQ